MKTDPVTLELFKNALFSIADEMAVTICRTTYSGVLRDNMDFSTAFTDAGGPELWWSERWRMMEAMRTYYEQCGPHRTELSIRNCAHCTCLFSRLAAQET